ncbi:kelch domain-containing protein 4-like [Clavelina lepadiformis]|uniref:kelch domain-containing protein 4-like n=1 Tax=Clavelina lepadiformis TaxID=159417 RepID=UPI004041B2A2
MGKKGKKEKGRGAEKTAQKMAKKDQKGEGMEDLEALIAEFRAADEKRTKFNEEKCNRPSPRCNMTVTAHPDKDELIVFGGEYFNGSKTHIYNDVFVYNIKKDEWSKYFIPNPPPPRCAHQAVAVSKDGGQLWIFGGEFSSPNNTQFYHYKDLWVLHLKEHKWEQIKAPGGPSQRSGHRMIAHKKSIYLFGGFHESHSNFSYFNDSYLFSLSSYTWTKLSLSGTGPSPRSACQLAVTPNGILVVGGYSKVRVKRDVEKGTPHMDMFLMSEEADSKWKWTKIKDSGAKPWPRSGFSFAQMSPTRAVMFGGVSDDDEEEDLLSFFYNSLSCLDLISYRWFPMDLRKSKAHKKKVEEMKDCDAGEIPMETDDSQAEATTSSMYVLPCGRMNAVAAVKRGTMFVYGGIFEEDEKQITLNDLWSIDLKKMDVWKQLIEADDTSTDWCEENVSGSSSDEDEGHSKTSRMSPLDDHPPVESGQLFENYWHEAKEHWLEVASSQAKEEDRADDIRSNAQKLASAYFDNTSK